MTGNKQFVSIDDGLDFSIKHIESGEVFYDCDSVVELLNELNDEKEDWKNNCLKTVSENSILWNEISILMEQGAEPSDAFKNYLNDLKNKNKKLQGDFE